MQNKTLHLILQSLVLGIAGIIVIFCFFILLRIAPFGNRSLVVADANIQYLDFFSYLKDIFSGKNSLNYSFSNSLGGSSIILLSYYLSSPVNLLVVFFSKSSLNSFYDLAVAIKMALSIATFSYYLRVRFKNKLRTIFIILLSLCYGFMQYNIGQSNNIMWLDGVYMLPLILLGVWQVSRGKSSCILAISLGLSLIFNWYTGIINGLFSCFWLLFEITLSPENIPIKHQLRSFAKKIGIFVIWSFLGLMLSACLLLPTIYALKNGARGAFDWSLLKNAFNGSFLTTIEKYSIGTSSTIDGVALYCGSLPIVALFASILSHRVTTHKKIIILTMTAIVLAIIYWMPLSLLFSLMKQVDSYWYRYSYVASFFLIFVAAEYFSNLHFDKEDRMDIIKGCFSFAAILILLYQFKNYITINQLKATLITVIITTFLLLLSISLKNSKLKKLVTLGLIFSVIFELGLNAKQLWLISTNPDISYYKGYVSRQQKQIDALKKYDSSNYRILQTSSRQKTKDNLTANYNEALAFNYWSPAGYVSNMNPKQLELLSLLGHRTEQERMSIVNSPVLASDSLLGVKYILSDYKINGLHKVRSIKKVNGKTVYKNPYYLPLAFTNPTNITANLNTWNTFEYTNSFYTELVGKKLDLYEPVQHTTRTNPNGTISYILNSKNKKNLQLYGNIIWSQSNNGNQINVNNVYSTGYAKWLSPSLFYIPTGNGQQQVTINTNIQQSAITTQQFYSLNLQKLKKITREIQQKSQKLSFKNGNISSYIYSKENTYLYSTISVERGWTVKVNDKVIHPQVFAGTFMRLPIKAGNNKISMTYKTPYLGLGIIISILSIILIIMYLIIIKKYI
ncbi:YfhO family protein [Liquorilactobacillus mali]|uniref:Bacterial membrane protein yfho n=1 Tax=Liquorilactobacillus mali TaxID=1618 RepID=A0A0R2FH30_9LACO|nr:YfhO family protein [Liquorilactobacillus mali]KRN26891.1 bacterial membrane protein yfho [Liquorilactobacillus mali]